MTALEQALQILRVSHGNIRSLGPAGVFGPVYSSYASWLQGIEEAIAACEAELQTQRDAVTPSRCALQVEP